jgi:hypothetical protein
MVDQKHKTLRSFYCEDSLWEMYEVMTRDLDCSMDYLINEAMRHYARSRNYSLTGMSRLRQPPEPSYQPPARGYRESPPPPERSAPPPRPPTPIASDNRTIPISAVDRAAIERAARERAQPPMTSEWEPARRGSYPPGYRPPPSPRVPPPPPRRSAPPGHRYGPPEPPVRGRPAPQPPPPPTSSRGAVAYAPSAGPRVPLYLFFNGQRFLIDKERFVIGRGSQHTDLTIRDGNISRKHAAVIYHEGQYYLQDLGSTNGIEYRGARIESRPIEEGDSFNICDYELRFSYVG